MDERYKYVQLYFWALGGKCTLGRTGGRGLLFGFCFTNVMNMTEMAPEYHISTFSDHF